MTNDERQVTSEIEQARPLTFEQLWGVPPDKLDLPAPAKDDLCIFHRIHCNAWENGCVVDKCFLD